MSLSSPEPSSRGQALIHRCAALNPFALPVMMTVSFIVPEIVQWLLLVALIVMIGVSFRHSRKLCEVCLAHFPVNPSAEAERRRRWLRIHHGLGQLRMLLYLTLAAVATYLLRPLITELSPAGRFAFIMVIVVAPIFLQDRAGWIHSHLRPWCPWCDHGGGGGEHSPTPTPQPTISR